MAYWNEFLGKFYVNEMMFFLHFVQKKTPRAEANRHKSQAYPTKIPTLDDILNVDVFCGEKKNSI